MHMTVRAGNLMKGWHPGMPGVQVGTVSKSDTQAGGRGHVCSEQQENPLTIKVSI